MGFHHLILIAAVFLSNRALAFSCPFQPEDNNPDITEKNFLGIWYPHFFISNYDVSVDDIGRFSCVVYKIEKDKSNHYSMKLNRYKPEFKHDVKLHMYDDFVLVNKSRFGHFWHREQTIGSKSTPSGYMKIVARFTRYMIILSCDFVEGRSQDLSINGFVLGRAAATWSKDNLHELIPTMDIINESIQKYLIPLKVGHEFVPEMLSSIIELNVAEKYMVLQTCVGTNGRASSIHAIIMGRKDVLWDDNKFTKAPSESHVLTRTLRLISQTLTNTNNSIENFKELKLSQDYKLCSQFNPDCFFNKSSGVNWISKSSMILISFSLMISFVLNNY